MSITEIAALVAILSGLGNAAVDVTKIHDAMKAQGRLKASPAEMEHIETVINAISKNFDPVGFLKAAEPGNAGG
jgi:hypothetical protein